MLNFTKQNKYSLADLKKYGINIPVIFHGGQIFSVAPRSLYNTLHNSFLQFVDQIDPLSEDGDEMALARTSDDIHLVSIRTADRIVTFYELEDTGEIPKDILEFGMVCSDLSIMIQSVGPLDFSFEHPTGGEVEPITFNDDFDMLVGSMILSLPSFLARQGSDAIIQSLNGEIERLHDDYQRRIKELRDDTQIKQLRIEELEGQIGSLEQTISTLHDEVALVAELKKAKQSLEEQLAEERLQIDELNKQIRQLESEHATMVRAMQAQIESLRSKLMADAWSYSSEIASLKAENKELRSQLSAVRNYGVSRPTSAVVTTLAAVAGVVVGQSARDRGVKIINVQS